MSQLKLTADSGGGTVAIKGPASTTGNGAIELTAPGTGNGTILTTNSSVGKILQVVNTTQESVVSYANSGYVDLSGITATINGVTSGSKIIVDIRLMYGRGAVTGVGFKLFRDSTFLPFASGAAETFAQYIAEHSTDWQYGFHNLALRYTDTHGQSGGSNLVYKLQGTTYSSSNTVYLNRRHYDSGQRGQCSVLLMEVAA
jgi:hypothetical protein